MLKYCPILKNLTKPPCDCHWKIYNFFFFKKEAPAHLFSVLLKSALFSGYKTRRFHSSSQGSESAWPFSFRLVTFVQPVLGQGRPDRERSSTQLLSWVGNITDLVSGTPLPQQWHRLHCNLPLALQWAGLAPTCLAKLWLFCHCALEFSEARWGHRISIHVRWEAHRNVHGL